MVSYGKLPQVEHPITVSSPCHRHRTGARDPAHGGQHGHAAVLQLRFAEPADVDGQREAHGVEALLFACGEDVREISYNVISCDIYYIYIV